MNYLSKFTLVFLFGTVCLFAQPMPSDPDWRMLQHDIYHTGLSPLQGDMDTCYVMWACTLADSNFKAGAPVSIGDVDNDGILEVVILGEYPSWDLYVINGNDGSVQWFDTTYGGFGMPLIEDINGDGTQEIIFADNYDSTLHALNGEDGSVLWGYKMSCDNTWGNAVCGDIDEDGLLEVVFQIPYFDHKVYALEGEDGSFKWSYTTGGQVYSSPVLGDVDNDGKREVVFGSLDSTVYALNGEDGSLLWSYETNGMSEASFSLGDIDNDDSLEVIFGSGDNKVCALEGEDGSFKWSYTMSDILGDLSAPAIGDIEGDGTREIVVRAENDSIYALNGEDGSFIWSCEAGDFNNSGLVLGDVDGDGKLEAVYHVSGSTAARDGEDGSLLWSFFVPGGVDYSTPSLADIDNDGKLEVVFSESNIVYALNGEESGIEEEINTGGLFSLSPADPNPFTTKTTIQYELSKRSDVDVSVYNMLGQKVRDLFSGKQSSGVHSVSWDGRGDSGEKSSSGIYFVRVEAGDEEASRKVMFVR